MAIIDCRQRPPFSSLLNAISKVSPKNALPKITRSGYETIPSVTERSMELFLQEAQDAGIRHGVLTARQCGEKRVNAQDMVELRQRFPSFFLGALIAMDAQQAVKDILGSCMDIKKQFQSGYFMGLALEPLMGSVMIAADDPRLYPLYEVCEESHALVYLTMSASENIRDLSYVSPAAALRIANDFPSLQIVVVHGCQPFASEMVGCLMSNTGKGNLWAMMDFYNTIPGLPGKPWVDAVEQHICDRRVIWGSGYPVRPLGLAVSEMERMGFSDASLEKIFWDNPLDLFRRNEIAPVDIHGL